MKKFVTRLASFLGFTVIFYLVFVIISGLIFPDFIHRNLVYTLGGNGFMHSRMQDLEHTSDVDILFLGSSRAYRGFDVRVYNSCGFSTFNLGSSSQTPIQTLLLLKRHLNKLNPKKVIFEVNPDIMSSEGVESAIDILSNGESDYNSLKMCLQINHIKVYNTMIYSVFHNIIGTRKRYKEPATRLDDRYITHGFVETKNTDFDHAPMTNTCDLHPGQIEAFKEIMSILAAKKIPTILIQSPIYKSTYDTCKDTQTFAKMMNTAGNYTDYNFLFPHDDNRYFLDGMHLNQKGVALFNEMILEDIFR